MEEKKFIANFIADGNCEINEKPVEIYAPNLGFALMKAGSEMPKDTVKVIVFAA